MAAFRQHIAVSSTLGAAYTASCIYLGTEWSLAALGGLLCALGGMLLLAERPTLATALGASLIALAILAVQYRVSLLAATSRVQRALRSTGLDPSSASSLP